MMADLIAKLEGKYDYIIIDTPPINMVVDVVPLVRLVDGVVLVIRDNDTTHPEINRAIETLKVNNAKISGIIVNQVSPHNNGKKSYSAYAKKAAVYRSKTYY